MADVMGGILSLLRDKPQMKYTGTIIKEAAVQAARGRNVTVLDAQTAGIRISVSFSTSFLLLPMCQICPYV
jgi:hypothetical protein